MVFDPNLNWKLKPGVVVLVVVESSSDVGLSFRESPPIKRIPDGDCHATQNHRGSDRVWDLFHIPSAKVTQVFLIVLSEGKSPPHPPHAVGPDCVWDVRGEGREGKLQLRPLGRITSTDVRKVKF